MSCRLHILPEHVVTDLRMTAASPPDPRFVALYEPALEVIVERSGIADGAFIDKEIYCVFVATLWANVVLAPSEAALTEADLEPLHDYLNRRIGEVLGQDRTLHDCFRFVRGTRGEPTMDRLHLTQVHKDMLAYFASMILDPEGHRRMTDEIRAKQAAERPPRRPYPH